MNMNTDQDNQWSASDLEQFAEAGISESEAMRQLKLLREGAPFADVVAAATA